MSRFLQLALLLALALSACATAPESGADPPRREVVLVAGGSGRAGIYLIRQLKAQGIAFRATTRSIAEARQRLGAEAEGIDWVEADLRDAAAARSAVSGTGSIISVIGSRDLTGANSAEYVDYGAVRNLVDAAKAGGLRHFVLLTAIGTSDKESFANKLFKGALEWRYKGEEYLRASGIGYTIVRPAGLTNDPAGTKGVKFYQGDDWKMHLRKSISRDDLALVLIESLRAPGARNASFEVVHDAAEPPGSWRAQFTGLKAD
jgi:uncharacterized protein YbjT (DUF2867 family)